MSRVFLWAGMALAGLAVAGLWVSILSRPEATVAADPSPTATVEQQIKPDPTQRPTPEPVPDGADEYLVFLNHTVDFMDSFSLDPMIRATDRFDLNGIATEATGLYFTFGDELDWLGRHRPADCYRTEFKLYEQAVRAYYRAFDLVSDGALYMDVPAINQGSRLMAQGNRLLTRSTNALGRTDCGFASSSSAVSS